MNTTLILDEEIEELTEDTPGSKLAKVRQDKGFSVDYVAGKLHLRVQIIELLELDDYKNMPEPVFIKGYLRAYAKLLEIDPEPLLQLFNTIYVPETSSERTLWQTQKETNLTVKTVRWLTGLFAATVILAIAVWWHNSSEHTFKKNNLSDTALSTKSETEVKLTDLSKMRSLLSPDKKLSGLELPE